MGNWIYVNENGPMSYKAYCDRTGSVLDHRFNICQGLEPMQENVFKYLVESILKSEYAGQPGYICVAYNPSRSDSVSAIQTSRPLPDDGFSVEVVLNRKSGGRDFTILCKKELSLTETINLLRLVLVGYQYPDIHGWIDVTGMIRYLHQNEEGGD